MNEFDKLYENEFFILTSDNLNEFKSKLFGFAITNEGIFFDITSAEKLDGNGCYIYIHKENNKISIYQDFCGSYGLFVYNNDNYFAISNSFFKLVEFLKDKVVLNLNSDFAYSFIPASPCSNFFKETLINEIQVLPQDYIIDIDITNATLEYIKIEYDMKTVPIDSEECLNILDEWYFKWTNIFNFLYENTHNLQFSLSGGFDSRVLLTLLLTSNIDLNKINILTFISEKPTFKEDFEIASQIACDFGFELNSPYEIEKYYFNELSTPINLSYYLRGGFAKQMYWKNYMFVEKNYHIRGLGGELLRNFYTDQSIDTYITNQSFIAQNYSNESSKSTKRILENTFEEYSNIHKTFNESELLNIHYMHTRNRFYSGTQITEDYLTNNVILSPLMDPLLNKIHVNAVNNEFRFLLPCLIFLRYCPEVLNYKFQGGREINKETFDFANKINNISPFKRKNINSFISNVDLNQKIEHQILSNEVQINQNDPYNFLKNIFDSNEFKKLFSMFFPMHIYEKIQKEENQLYPDAPTSDLNAVIATMKSVEAVMFSHLKLNNTPYNWLNGIKDYPITNIDEKPIQKNIDDVRIDFKNYGEEYNDVIILDISDYNARLLKPEWFTNSEGIGLIVESSSNTLNIKLKCVRDGILHMGLKSRDVWDDNNKRINITFERVLINSFDVLGIEKIASHDNPFVLKREVNHGDIFDIDIHWYPVKNNQDE